MRHVFRQKHRQSCQNWIGNAEYARLRYLNSPPQLCGIQCTLKEYIEVGDHYLYICNVEQVLADEQEEAVFALNGYGKICAAKQSD